MAACFSSKIERLPRGGGLEGSTLPSKSNLFLPLDKGVFINTLVRVGGQIGGSNFFRSQKEGGSKKNKAGMRGDQKFSKGEESHFGCKN